MSFVKLFLALLVVFNSSGFCQTPFSVAAPLESEASESSGDESLRELISRLKQDAVILWLRDYLGEKANSYEKSVTPDFAESYILDYRVTRTGENKNIIQLSGHIDTDSIKGWLRVSATKLSGNSSLKPALVVSSSPNISLSEGQQNVLENSVKANLNRELKKLRVAFSDIQPPPLDAPPRDESGITELASRFQSKGFNFAIWVYLNRCRSCSMARLDIYSFSLSNAQVVTSLSEELPSFMISLQTEEQANSLLSPFFKTFQQDFERAIAEGRTSSQIVTLTVEGLENYRAYKKLEYLLSQQSFFSDLTPKHFIQNTAQFEAVSPLNSTDVARRIQALSFSEGKVDLVRVDSRNVIVRYSR